MEKEIRVFNCKVRASKKGDKRQIVGYAAVFNKMSEDLGGFREVIKPGTFKKTIQEADIRALFNHDPNYVLGRNKSGTLRLEENSKGLKVIIDPPKTHWADDLMESMSRGDITQMSFGFQTVKDSWIEEEGKELLRELREVRLFDVSPVTYPAYPDTKVGLRKYEEYKQRMGYTDDIEIMKMKTEIVNVEMLDI